MRLKKLFLLTTVLLLALVTAMLVRAFVQELNSYRAAQTGLQVMQLARLAMTIAEKSSVERDPAFAFMSSDAANHATARDTLTPARQQSDIAFAEAFAALKAHAGEPTTGTSAAALQISATALSRARDQLHTARQEVDRVAKTPRAERRNSAIVAAHKRMIGAIDIVFEAVAVLSGNAGRVYPDLVDALVASHMAAELREQAGRLGSQLTFALAHQAPLQPEEVREIQTVRGRIDQLLNLIWLRNFVGNLDAWQSTELAEVRLRYVEVGLPLVKSLTEAGAEGRPYGMSAEGFNSLYAPEMTSILHLRDTLFRIANEGGKAAYQKTFRSMILQLVIGIAVILLEIAVFLFIRRRVLRPLITANTALVDISQGKLDITIPPVGRTDEIGDMINAVVALRATSLEKRHLEQERERRIEDLTEASSVDPLTGLINRRAFFERAATQLATASRHQWAVTVIAMDIDHFKEINDRYGHAHGDLVLVEVAQCIKRALRVPDVAARFGGEEFIVVAVECDSAAGYVLAERLRTAIAAAEIKTNGHIASVTVSAGVVTLEAPHLADLRVALKHADTALYDAKNQGRNRTVVAQPKASTTPPPSPESPPNPSPP